MYAIRNTKTGKWLVGTNRQRSPWRQNTSADMALTFESFEDAKLAFLIRRCGKGYEIVRVRLEVVE